MSFVVDSQSNQPITLDLTSDDNTKTSSLHLAPFQKRVVIDEIYRNSRDIVNGLRTRVLSISFDYSVPQHAVESKSVPPDEVELRKTHGEK